MPMRKNSQTDWLLQATAELQPILANAQTILVITHVDPDGDAIGSLTATGLALQQLGKQAILLCDDPAPEQFSFLPLVDAIHQPPLSPSVNPDLLIAVDCGDEARMGASYASLAQPRPSVVNIDHHRTNTKFGILNIVSAEAPATAEMLFPLFQGVGVQIDQAIAECLLTGLITDTLGFRTPSVTVNTVAVASALMAAGANLARITEKVLNIKPLSTIRLYQKGLNNMRFQAGLLWTSISNEERIEVGHQLSGGAGLVNLLGDTAEAAMGCFLLQMGDGTVNVSFRCREPWDVATVATALGGGGHQLAAGCTLSMPLAEAERIVTDAALAAIDQQRKQQQSDHV